MKRKLFLFVLFVALAPTQTFAALFINEVAWMGTVTSATDEWIEIVNDGADLVSLTGWKLIAEDGSPSIALSGSISASGYYLLERTDDESVSGIPADKIYTGDLGNTGETLKILDKDGVVVDTASGGANWENLGGNNTTKHTAQRQADGTWITGVPTPKAINSTEDTGGEVAGTSTSSSSSSSTTAKKTITGGYKQVVFAYAGEDRLVTVGAQALFEGYGVSDKNIRISAANYAWSFGDGGKGKGKEEAHTYRKPGTYTVVLNVSGDNQRAKDKLMVTAVPAEVRLSDIDWGNGGYIEVANGAETELDLSRWQIHIEYEKGSKSRDTFTFPDDTLIAPRSAVKFPEEVTELLPQKEDRVELLYPGGKKAATYEPNAVVENKVLGYVEEVVPTASHTESVLPYILAGTLIVSTLALLGFLTTQRTRKDVGSGTGLPPAHAFTIIEVTEASS
ncbi:MAG: lamin tail domain-containing protein [Patescibacteria group bacterium]